MRKDRLTKISIALLFLAILAIGLCVFDDYGICIDEPLQRRHSVVNYREINEVLLGRHVYGDFEPVVRLDEYSSKYYGVAMQLPLVFAEDCYKHLTGQEMPLRTIYLMRHLYTFLVYYLGLICFYFLIKHLFGSCGLAIVGVLMVFLFGRFFAHAFYNIKDMLFTSLMMICLLCAERVLATNRRSGWCLLFALSSALMVTSRIVGALLIVFLLFALLIEDIRTARRTRAEGLKSNATRVWKRLLPYVLICCAYPIWLVLTPASWSDPIGFSLGYCNKFSNYDGLAACNFYHWGQHLWISDSQAVPCDYLITWITLTVPIINQLLCLAGIAFFGVRSFSKRQENRLSSSSRCILWIMLAIIAGTILYQVIFRPLIYNGWRHAFYLYPMMIAFAVYGLWSIWSWAKNHNRKWIGIGVSILLAGSLTYNAYQIVYNHPNQYALFNSIGRHYADEFERDYWSLSTRTMAEWLLENRDGDELRYYCNSALDGLPFYMLKEGYGRLQFYPLEESDYVLSVVRGVCTNDFPIEGFEEIHAIWVDDVKIACIYEKIGD